VASSGYLGADEVNLLIGQWVDLVGGDDDDDKNDNRWWRRPPPWWRQSKRDWDRLPELQQRQYWQSFPQQQGQGYPGGQQWPPPGYPQQPPYGQPPYGQPPYQQQQQPPQWWWQQPAWWRQQNPWYPQMQWQAQQPQQPPWQQPQPQSPQTYPTDPSGQNVWVPASGGRAGYWTRGRAPVVRDHRSATASPGGGAGGAGGGGGGGGVTVTSRARAAQESGWSPFGTGTVGQWYDLMGPMVGQLPPPPDAFAFPFPARAAVVTAPMPTQANRDILPMSTGVPILPTQSAQITGRPQVMVFKIGRFVISNAGTAGGAADWIVNDIKIGNRSQFVQSGDVPGDLFAVNAIDTFVRFEAAQTAMDVVVVVTYIGLNESGAPFFGAMVGTAAI